MRSVYLDHAATTPVHPQVIEAMLPLYTKAFGNPSSPHVFGREARKYLEEAREKIAQIINAERAIEIVFTSGGTEADNLAIKGVALHSGQKKRHLITSAVEHHAVYDTCKTLEKQGFKVTILPVDKYGLVNPEDLKNAITDDTFLVSIMHANNEVGTIQPIKELAKIARDRGVLFHTDAVQTVGAIPVDVRDLGVDMLSLSGHKFYGPKGVGALYIRRGVRLAPLTQGGSQEFKRKPGTENVPGIYGMAKALELALADMKKKNEKLIALRKQLMDGIEAKISRVYLNGHPEKRLPANVNFSIEYIEGESILLSLDMKGIAASSGSACTSGSLEPSHVLLAMGLTHEIAHGSLRLTMGRETTQEDIDYVLETLPPIIERLRAMSPLTQCGA